MQKLNANSSPELIQELVRVYRSHKPAIQLYPDASWILEHLRGKAQLGIITDGFLKTQQNKVAALGIEGLFDCIVYSDSFGAAEWKPSPTPYKTLMKRLECYGAECIYVADNPLKDFVSAKRLGWRTVQIVREGGIYSSVSVPDEFQASLRITSLRTLAELISI